jgi:hypothetical protein
LDSGIKLPTSMIGRRAYLRSPLATRLADCVPSGGGAGFEMSQSATRYDRGAHTFMSAIALAAIFWL